MCGVIGLIKENVLPHIVRGLLNLQHRGQNAAGIFLWDGENVKIVKGKGLVKDVLRGISGKAKVGIGHVRYPTVGRDLESDAQPFFVNYPKGIAMAHNGNVVNYDEVKAFIEKEGKRKVVSGCDVELILNLFSMGLESGDVWDGVKMVMDHINGSYSVVAYVIGEGLVAFRDPWGIRPLVYNDHGFASESIALSGDVEPVKPGEAIILRDGDMERKVIKKGKEAHCMFEFVYFARPDSVLDGKDVYQARFELGMALGKRFLEMGLEADVVIPVPDTSRPAALGFSQQTGIPYREGLIKNRYAVRTFIMPPGRRESEVSIKLNPVKSVLNGKRVVVIDDSLVRGTTARNIVKIIKKAGAKEVYFLLTCPPIKYPCFYGIDMQTKKELAAATKDIEEIRKEIGADRLIYQEIDDLKAVLGIPICTACLTGDYPTNIDKKLFEVAQERRAKELGF